MAMNVDQPYFGWSHEESSDHDESQKVSASQMLDHGSISFGRFAFESLSWERRSVFTYNKPQEELEKFKSPGLVAQKKAYFEEYYKRIRALKAMQENQQTELTLDYGGDGSLSSQTGEEDETAAQHGSLGDGASNIIDACSKEASIEITLEKEHNCEAIQVRHLDKEPASSNLDLSRKGLDEIERERNTSYAFQMQNLDTEFTVHESLIESKEDIEQRDLCGLHGQGRSRKYEMSESNIEQEKNYTSAVQMQNLDSGSTVHESLARTEEIEHHECKGISGKYDNIKAIIKPEVALAGPLLYPTKSKAGDLELKPDNNFVSGKMKPIVKKYKEEQFSVSKVKGPAPSVRNGLKLELKTQSETKSSQGPKYPSQNTTSKAKTSVGLSKSTAARVSRNYKSTPVASHRPLTEVRSNVTIPRPFSLSMERRASVLAGTRDSAPRLTQTSNGLADIKSLSQAKDVIHVQGKSKKAINYDVKNRGLENKRVSEEVGKLASSFQSRCTSLKGRGANAPGPPKARSLNLPARNQFNPNLGSGSRSSVRKDKLEEGKEDARSREVRRTGTKIAAPPRTGNLKAENKKVVKSQADQLSRNERKPRIGGLSHDGTKPSSVVRHLTLGRQVSCSDHRGATCAAVMQA